MTDSGATRDGQLQEAVISACRELTRLRLTHGTSGNVSLRRDERQFFVSPTGMSYDALEADDIPLVNLDGRWFGRRLPSSEWRFHRAIFQSPNDGGAVLPTHSFNPTPLPRTRRGIPPVQLNVTL